MQRWEYKQVERLMLSSEMNSLGADGWELAGVAPFVGGSVMTEGTFGNVSGGTTTSFTLIFKRPLPD